MFHRISIKRAAAFLAAVLMIIAQCGCSSQPSAGSASDPVFGEDWLLNSYCYIKLFKWDETKAEKPETLISEAFRLARDKENLLSRTIATGDIGRFNAAGAGEAVSVDESTARLVQDGIAYLKQTEGRFDIGVGPLTSLWDFSAEKPRVPDAEAIEAALASCGYTDLIEIREAEDGFALVKPEAGVMLDLGALAKGYIADCLKAYLEEGGAERAIISLGGNIVLIGEKEDGSLWTVGVEAPSAGKSGVALEERETIGNVFVSGGSVVTSGTYERCFEEGGTVYHHVLDPATGYPAETDLVGVTITGESSELCDIYSTSCLLLGYEKGLEFINGIEGYEALFILEDGRTRITDGMLFGN